MSESFADAALGGLRSFQVVIERELVTLMTMIAFHKNLRAWIEGIVDDRIDSVKRAEWRPCARFAIGEDRSCLLLSSQIPPGLARGLFDP